MKLDQDVPSLLPVVLVVSLTCGMPAAAQQPEAKEPGNEQFNVEQLFASTCGFCHSDGGRAAGRGPQLMNSPRDDDYMRNRIAVGKTGAMPAFGAVFTEQQIDEIIRYIRALKPHQG